MSIDQGGLDNPFATPRYDNPEKPELGDVEPSIPYSYFVARNPEIGDTRLLDFVVEEYILDRYGQQEHRETVKLDDGECSWDEALNAHKKRIEALFRTLDAAIPNDARLMPADWGIINHMLRLKLEEKIKNHNKETGHNVFVSDDTSRMTEWVYIHYLFGALPLARKEELYQQLFLLDSGKIFEEFQAIPEQGQKENFSKVAVRPSTFFGKLEDMITSEELKLMQGRLDALEYGKTYVALNPMLSKDPSSLPKTLYEIYPELKKYHVSEKEITDRFMGKILHMMNQSINKQMMLQWSYKLYV